MHDTSESTDTIVEFLNERTRPGIFRTQDGVRYWVLRSADGPQAFLLDEHGFAAPLSYQFRLERRPIGRGRWLGDVDMATREILSVRQCEEQGILCSCRHVEFRFASEPTFMVAICEHYLRIAGEPDSVARWELTTKEGEVLFESRELY